MKPDARDACAIGGLSLVAIGVALVYPPGALMVVGVALMALGLWRRGHGMD